MLGLVPIQPVEPLVTFEDRHLPVLVRRDVGVRLGGQDGIGLRPLARRGSPDNSDAGMRQRWLSERIGLRRE